MLEKNDFIEIEFLGRVKGGEIFDTNIKEKAREINLEIDTKPLIICIGQAMMLPALDNAFLGKEIGKEYSLELKAKDAFGLRDKNLIKTIPIKVFLAQKINPQQGMVLNMDGILVRIAAVSGGRVIADFNNPLAGKEVIYNFTIKRKIESLEEKAKALIDFFLRKEFKFEINEGKLVIEASEPEQKFISLFKDKFKEILNLDLEFKNKAGSTKVEGNPEKKEKEEKPIKNTN